MALSEIYISKQTIPRFYDTKKGKSKKMEWVQIEGVPASVINKTETTITLNSFTSSKKRVFTISISELDELFDKTSIDETGFINGLTKYIIPVHISEFKKRDDIDLYVSRVNKIIKDKTIPPYIKSILNDKLFQLLQSQGAKYINIDDYISFKNGDIKLSKHKRFGFEIFNRNVRWCPPVDIDYTTFTQSPSYPAPIGIRPKDFCLPSELCDTMNELIYQISTFKNIDRSVFSSILYSYKSIIDKKEIEYHTCKYCGDYIDMNKYTSQYKSVDNYIEICHRNPDERFVKSNIYFGHGCCNRKQGGCSEITIIEDAIKLLELNPMYIDKYKDKIRLL